MAKTYGELYAERIQCYAQRLKMRLAADKRDLTEFERTLVLKPPNPAANRPLCIPKYDYGLDVLDETSGIVPGAPGSLSAETETRVYRFVPNPEYEVRIGKSTEPTVLVIGEENYVIKKYLSLPRHLTRRFPNLADMFAFGGGDGARLWLIHHQLLKLLKAASEREPSSDTEFAKMIFSFWNYSNEGLRQLEYFVELIVNSGAPDDLVLDFARPEGYGIRSVPGREVKLWVGAFIARAMLRGKFDLAVKLACRLDCFGAAKRIRERNNRGLRLYSFRNYDEALVGVLVWVHCDMKARQLLRVNAHKGPLNHLPCANYFNGCHVAGTVQFMRNHVPHCAYGVDASYRACKDCKIYLRPEVGDLHADHVGHYAVCEKRRVVFTEDRYDMELFEIVPYPPAGPFGPVKLVPPENNDRLFGQMFEFYGSSGAPGGIVIKFRRVLRYA